MNNHSIKFTIYVSAIVFVIILILIAMLLIPCRFFRCETVINTAIICSTCIMGLFMICSFIYEAYVNKTNKTLNQAIISEEEIKLLEEIKTAFSKEPTRIDCCCNKNCNKNFNNTVNIRICKK